MKKRHKIRGFKKARKKDLKKKKKGTESIEEVGSKESEAWRNEDIEIE